jgi:hypothetical protein
MKKHLLFLILFPIIGISQTYKVTTPPTYGKDPRYSSTTFTIEQTTAAPAPSPNYVGDALSRVQNNIIQAQQANAQRDAQREHTQAIIDSQNRIESQRILELKNKQIEQERIKQESNPNSILNKFKNANLKQENEDLKSKLLQMELLLAEKERLEKVRIEKEKAQKKN